MDGRRSSGPIPIRSDSWLSEPLALDGFPLPQRPFDRRCRDRSIAYVRETKDDHRACGNDTMDAYQYLVLMSGHTRRHTAQWNEVKQDPKYPK